MTTISLLRLFWLQPWLRRMRSSSLVERLKTALFLLGFVAFIAVLTAIIRPVLAYFWGVEYLGPILSRRAVYLVLSTLLGLEAFSAVIALSSRLFEDADADLFLSSPLDARTYFRFKFLQACVSTGWMLLPIWLPLMLAMRAAAHWSWLQLAWGLFIPLALSPLVSALALVFVMEITRLISPGRVKLFFVVLSAVAAVGIVFLIRLIQPEKLADPASAVSAAEILKNWSMPEPWWNPARLATDAVLGFDGLAAMKLFGAAALVLTLGLTYYAPRFYATWQRVRAIPASASAFKGASWGWNWAQGIWSVLWMKEFSSFSRNSSQRLQLLFVAGLTAIFLYNLHHLPLKNDASLMETLFFPACGFSQLILIAVATRFVFPAESAEASSSWLLRSAPLSQGKYLFSRMVIYTPPLLVLNAVLIGSCVRVFDPTPAQEFAAWMLGFFSPLGVVAMTAGLGLAWKRSSNVSPDELVTSSSGVLVMLACLTYIFGELGLLAIPLHEYHRIAGDHLAWLKSSTLLWGVTAFLWLLLQLAVLGIPMRMAARRMEDAG